MNSTCILVSNPGMTFHPASLPAATSGQAPSAWPEKIEALVLRFIVGLLVVSSIGCGFGVQHIAYVRQKNELGRQLRQKELELAKVEQAYRTLESFVVRLEEARAPEVLPVVAKRPARKGATRS